MAWVVMAGGWWLVAGGWWLVAGGWWLVGMNLLIFKSRHNTALR
ncbi:hypothetical protein ACSFM0_004694 [Escherichia coli]